MNCSLMIFCLCGWVKIAVAGNCPSSTASSGHDVSPARTDASPSRRVQFSSGPEVFGYDSTAAEIARSRSIDFGLWVTVHSRMFNRRGVMTFHDGVVDGSEFHNSVVDSSESARSRSRRGAIIIVP